MRHFSRKIFPVILVGCGLTLTGCSTTPATRPTLIQSATIGGTIGGIVVGAALIASTPIRPYVAIAAGVLGGIVGGIIIDQHRQRFEINELNIKNDIDKLHTANVGIEKVISEYEDQLHLLNNRLYELGNLKSMAEHQRRDVKKQISSAIDIWKSDLDSVRKNRQLAEQALSKLSSGESNMYAINNELNLYIRNSI